MFILKAYRETARHGGWADLYTPPLYNPSSTGGSDRGVDTLEEFVIRAPILDGKNGYYRHLMKVY